MIASLMYAGEWTQDSTLQQHKPSTARVRSAYGTDKRPAGRKRPRRHDYIKPEQVDVRSREFFSELFCVRYNYYNRTLI